MNQPYKILGFFFNKIVDGRSLVAHVCLFFFCSKWNAMALWEAQPPQPIFVECDAAAVLFAIKDPNYKAS
jgi:hypothetical protein